MHFNLRSYSKIVVSHETTTSLRHYSDAGAKTINPTPHHHCFPYSGSCHYHPCHPQKQDQSLAYCLTLYMIFLMTKTRAILSWGSHLKIHLLLRNPHSARSYEPSQCRSQYHAHHHKAHLSFPLYHCHRKERAALHLL